MLRNRETSWPLLDVCSELQRRRGCGEEMEGEAGRRNPFQSSSADMGQICSIFFFSHFHFFCRGGTDEWKDTSLLSILQIDVRGTRDTDATDVTCTHARRSRSLARKSNPDSS